MAEHMHSQDAPSVPNTTADPKPACDSALLGNVDVEFKLMDVESEILDVANALAAKLNRGSFGDYLLPGFWRRKNCPRSVLINGSNCCKNTFKD
jgi:hypothetical protein